LILLPSLIAGVTMLSGAFLPFAVAGAIVLGIKKLSDYLGDVKIKAFEIATGFKDWPLDILNVKISEMEETIAGLETELEEAEKGFNLFGITITNQDVNIDRLKQVIKDTKIQLGLLEEQRRKLTGAEEEGIDVTEERLKIDEEAKELLETLAQKEEEARIAREAELALREKTNAQAEIENKIYALTHTAMEVTIRDLDLLKKEYLKKGIAQEIVDEWYGKEILRLEELNKKQEEHISTMEEVARVTKAVEDAIFELTHEPYEAKIKEINERYDDYIKVIKESNLSLLAQETLIRNVNIARDLEIEGVDILTEAEKENIKQKEELEDAYENIKDRILELKDPREAAIKRLDDEKQRLIDLGMAIELVMEWYDKVIEKLGEVGEAFEALDTIVKPIITAITGYIEDQLSVAIYNLWSDMEDYKWSWDTFWEGLWDVVKRTVSNIIAKLLILIPILAVVAWFTGGLSWAQIVQVASWVGISLNKGGGVGYDAGGKVKGYQFGGVADTIPARLTVGEYVIAKPMTDFIKRFKTIPQNLLDAVIRGLPTPIPAFAAGGPVGTSNIASTSFGETNINVYISGNNISSELDIKRLATKVSDEIVRKINLLRRH